MKNTFIKIFFLLGAIICSLQTYAANNPPPPTPTPPGLSIDKGMLVLFTMAILFGYIFINKIYRKKTPN